ncbi:MAG: maleylacetoacetate isomerase [Burkholderiaceae bacterium]|jgi:maleylacetoacetate isomerase
MTDTPRFELYSFWRTSATYRVRVALNLKGLSAQERFIDIDAGAQRSEAFLKLNPLGALPAFVDHAGPKGQEPLTQSLAILEYLEEIQPSPPLLPATAAERARVRSLCGMVVADTHPLITPRIRKYLTTQAQFDDAAWRRWQTQWFTTGLQALETRLASSAATGRYCHGESLTLADICLASILVVMRVFRIDVAGIPTVERIMHLCEENEAFARADPLRQEGAPKS